MLLKMKFRDVKGLNKNIMGNYANYIESQVKDRKTKTNEFEKWDSDFDTIKEEEDFISENILMLNEDNVFDDIYLDENGIFDAKSSMSFQDEYNYQEYKKDKENFPTLFSDYSADIKELKSLLNSYDGIFWIPILSLREDDARNLKMDKEDIWIEQTRKIVPIMAEKIGIPISNLNWVAGFHEKPESKQKVAGKQPHVHIIIWEKVPQLEKGRIKETNFQELREDIKNILNFNKQEKEFKEKISNSKEENENNSILLNNINSISKNRSSFINITDKENLIKSIEVLENIRDKKMLKNELSNKEIDFLEGLNLSETVDYNTINERILQGHNLLSEAEETGKYIRENLENKFSLFKNQPETVKHNFEQEIINNILSFQQVKRENNETTNILDYIKYAKLPNNVNKKELKHALVNIIMVSKNEGKETEEVLESIKDFNLNNEYPLSFQEIEDVLKKSKDLSSSNPSLSQDDFLVKNSIKKLGFDIEKDNEKTSKEEIYSLLLKAINKTLINTNIVDEVWEEIRANNENEAWGEIGKRIGEGIETISIEI